MDIMDAGKGWTYGHGCAGGTVRPDVLELFLFCFSNCFLIVVKLVVRVMEIYLADFLHSYVPSTINPAIYFRNIS